nr:hypothetical protein [Tanacetum cinerariifolium]
MYYAEDEGFEFYPPLNDDEVGKDDLVLMCSDLENDCMNDAAKILEGMSEGMNDASKSIEFNEDNESDFDENGDEYSETKSDEFNKSFDYLSNGKDEQDTTLDVDKYRELDDNGLGLTPLIREHEKYMEALLRKLKGIGIGITDLFAIIDKSKEMYPIYDDLTHWKLVKLKKYKDKVVAKCGQRKETIKDPSKADVTIQDHYGYLMSYAKALTDSNEDSIIKVVGRDGNNNIYHVAWFVVTVENKENWSWALDLLADDLELLNGNGLTLMSDQHKGLIKAVKDVMSLAEHHNCKASADNIYVRVNKSDSHGEDEHHEILDEKIDY